MSQKKLKTRRAKILLPKLNIRIAGARLDFNYRTHVMGVLNMTPDSFFDGGMFFYMRRRRSVSGIRCARGASWTDFPEESPVQSKKCPDLNMKAAILRGLEIASQGADIIDIGGESTRPGAKDVTTDEEISRVIPVIDALVGKIDIPISIDTRKSEVALAAIKSGASIVNDVSALRHDKRMRYIISKYGVAVILMHIKGTPKTMQVRPSYKDVVKEVIDSLDESIGIAVRSGIQNDKIIVDPGIGFGKTLEHNIDILKRLEEFHVLKRPICIGVSRKNFIGKITGTERPADRLAGTIAASVIAITKGVSLIRAHDVKETVDAVRVADRILGGMPRPNPKGLNI